jgi:hypothetical protein
MSKVADCEPEFQLEIFIRERYECIRFVTQDGFFPRDYGAELCDRFGIANTYLITNE